MSLVFTALTPHPPLLIPPIGQDNLEKVKNTTQAMEELSEKFKASKPDIVLLISPHGLFETDAFTINNSDKYNGNFKQFGDLITKLELDGSPSFAHDIKEQAKKTPIKIVSEEILDHGSLVPLYFLTQKYKDFDLVQLGFSALSLKEHYDWGKTLKEIINDSSKRIAVIASGDMSHRLTEEAPAGFSPDGEKFDQKILEILKKHEPQSIVNFDPTFIEEAGECGLRSLTILLGILDNTNYETEILNYEGPFGVGYLVANFAL